MRNMTSLKIFIVFIFFSKTDSATTDDIIESCLYKILKKYFRNKPILLISDLTIDNKPLRTLLPNLEKGYQQQIIEGIMVKRKRTLQIYNTNKYIGLPGRYKLERLKNCFFFIRGEIMSSEKLFQWEMDRLHNSPMWNPTGRTLVVIKSESTANDSAELARKVIDKLWKTSKSVDNLVMVAEYTGIVHFYTWFPYKQPDCSKVRKVVHLNTYKRGKFLSGANLFPPKVVPDLQGCELKAATEICVPYVLADENDGSLFVDGMEFQMMTSLSRILNFKLTTVTPDNMWTTFINDSLTGAFKLLVEQEVDMAFSCLMLNNERYLLALALPSYYEDALVWFVPSPTFRSHTFDIFFTFPVPVWLLMLCVVFSALFASVILVYVEFRSNWRSRVGEIMLRLVGVSFYSPVEVQTEKYNFRLFVFMFFLYSMHITVAFQSSLFDLYRQPQYHRVYTSLEQAVDAGLFVYLRASTEDLYNQSDHALWEKILRPDRHDYLLDFGRAFGEIAYDKSAMALFIKSTGIYMVSIHFTDEHGTPLVLWLKKMFSPYPITTYLPPGSPLFTMFEERIYHIIASGLIAIWISRAVDDEKLDWDAEGFANMPLTMTHMGGPFFLLLLMLSASIVVFLCELFVYHVVVKRKMKKKPDHRHFYKPPIYKSFEGKLKPDRDLWE